MIVIDMQNDFVVGALSTPAAKLIPEKIKTRIEKFREYKNYNHMRRVVFTRDTHTRGYLYTHEGKYLPVAHCIDETPGWCIVDELAGLDDYIINKNQFGYTGWREWFDHHNINPSKIYICGLVTNICVISNALILRALYPEIDIVVFEDLCAGTSPEMHKAALEIMGSCHINIERDGDVLSENMDGK